MSSINGSTYFEMNAEWTRFLIAYPNLALGLLAAAPVDKSGAGAIEIADAGYVRQPCAGDVFWEISLNGTLELRQAIEFPALTEVTSTVGWALFDAPVGGNLLKVYVGEAQTRAVGEIPGFEAGDILFSKNSR